MKEPFIYYQVGGGWLASFEGEELLKKYGLKEGGGGGSGEKKLRVKGRVGQQTIPLYFVVMAFVILQTAYPNAKNRGTY